MKTDFLKPITILKTPVRSSVTMTGYFRGGEHGAVQQFSVEVDPESPRRGIRALRQWFFDQTDDEQALAQARELMVDRLCTEIRGIDWAHATALWDDQGDA